MTIQPSLIIANAMATKVDHCLSPGNVMDTNIPPTNPPGQDVRGIPSCHRRGRLPWASLCTWSHVPKSNKRIFRSHRGSLFSFVCVMACFSNLSVLTALPKAQHRERNVTSQIASEFQYARNLFFIHINHAKCMNLP